jgi:hypothetical protein
MTEILVKIAFGLAIIFIAIYYSVKYLSNKHSELVQEPAPQEYTKEELDNIKLAEELYNKDLRPVVAKKAKTKPSPELEVVEPEFVAKESKPEFPIDKPKKKRKYYSKKKK